MTTVTVPVLLLQCLNAVAKTQRVNRINLKRITIVQKNVPWHLDSSRQRSALGVSEGETWCRVFMRSQQEKPDNKWHNKITILLRDNKKRSIDSK